MRRVLVTGAGSYIGGAVRKRMLEEPEAFFVEAASVRDGAWRGIDFSAFDSVVHVAGIAHRKAGEVSDGLYYEVNRDLAVDVACAAKGAGVSQFVLMSSMSVYGDSRPALDRSPIILETEPSPTTTYGKSKLEAEEGLRALESGSFRVAILRPPMVYGPGCKGNFPTLARLADKLPVFPDVDNLKSMIYIGNLTELVALVVANGASGTYLPQDAEPYRTSEVVRALARAQGGEMRIIRALNPLVRLLDERSASCRKAFGTLYYDLEASECGLDYRRYSFEEAVEISFDDDMKQFEKLKTLHK